MYVTSLVKFFMSQKVAHTDIAKIFICECQACLHNCINPWVSVNRHCWCGRGASETEANLGCGYDVSCAPG